MYLRVTERRNRDGSTVASYALAESRGDNSQALAMSEKLL
jgi:hypothetical protein